MQAGLLYIGASVIFIWGVGHMMPTRSIVAGFEPLSSDNRRIITMEWLAEGLTLSFLGLLVALVAFLVGTDQPTTFVVARASAVMLLILALLSGFTGARTSVLPMKLCPLVKTAVAACFLIATWI